MWFEALPSLIATGAFVGIPFALIPLMHKLVNNGNAFNRDLTKYEQRLAYYRDTRLTGNPYAQQGLEAIPDE